MSVLFKLKNYLQNRFLKNILTLMTGTILAQFIGFITLPIITRLYSAEQFGIYQNFSMIMSILMVIACLRYEQAIVLPEKQDEAKHLFFLCSIISIVVGVITFIIFLIFDDYLLSMMKLEGLNIFFSLGIIVLGFFQAVSYLMIRTQKYNLLARSKFLQIILMSFLQIILYYLINTNYGLILGYLLANLSLTIYLVSVVLANEFKDFKFSFKTVINQIVKHRKLPLINAGTSIIDNFAAAFPTFFFTKMFGLGVTGSFGLAYRMVNIPISLIGNSLSQVFLQKISEAYREEANIHHIIIQVIKKLSFFSLILLILMQFSPWIFGIVFGSNWRFAGEIAQLMSFAIAIRFIVSPLSSVFIICEKQEIMAIWQISYLITTVGLLVYSLKFESIYISIIFLVANDVVLYSFYLFLLLRVVKSIQVKRKVTGDNYD
ncbi:lipopolysaccharide biosynthesis protein [Paenibacillus silviterrae]|uniref:lipopolysaccharide biosynthesis protein n=1 Tax=Paenibacillus silviterrae TaxID=3242194 RepID=UPI002542E4AD|nr:oligosaccharide flippase family protein [Paenibacillus chinjuensis]